MLSGGGGTGIVISWILLQFPGIGPSLENRSCVTHVYQNLSYSFIWKRPVDIILQSENTDVKQFVVQNGHGQK